MGLPVALLVEQLAAAEKHKHAAYMANDFASLAALNAEIDRINKLVVDAMSSSTDDEFLSAPPPIQKKRAPRVRKGGVAISRGDGE